MIMIRDPRKSQKHPSWSKRNNFDQRCNSARVKSPDFSNTAIEIVSQRVSLPCDAHYHGIVPREPDCFHWSLLQYRRSDKILFALIIPKGRSLEFTTVMRIRLSVFCTAFSTLQLLARIWKFPDLVVRSICFASRGGDSRPLFLMIARYWRQRNKSRRPRFYEYFCVGTV